MNTTTENEADPNSAGQSGMSEAALEQLLNNPSILRALAERVKHVTPPAVSVNVSGSESVASSLGGSLLSTPQAAEMDSLYDNQKCCELRSKHVWASISNYLKDQVFPLIKFWTDSDAKFLRPDFKDSITLEKKEQARRICEKLLVFCRRIPDNGSDFTMRTKIAFWKTYVPNIKDGLVRYRSNVTADAKKMYIKGLFIFFAIKLLEFKPVISRPGNHLILFIARKGTLDAKEIYGSVDDLHSLCATDDLLQIRDAGNEDAFKAFVTIILPPIVRKIRFRNHKCNKPLSKYVTVPDEAFALLILENNYLKWEAYVGQSFSNGEDDSEAEDEDIQDPKKVKSKYGQETRNWTSHQNAIARYNTFVEKILQTRKEHGQQELEKTIMEDFAAKQGDKQQPYGLKRKFYEDGEEDGDSLEDSDDVLVAVKPIDSFF